VASGSGIKTALVAGHAFVEHAAVLSSNDSTIRETRGIGQAD
jgi:hypothetical protein